MFVKGDKKENFIPIQFYLDRDAEITDAESIVSVSAIARTTEVEPLQGSAKVSYRVTYRIIYKSEGGFRKWEDYGDFTAEISSEGISPKSFVVAATKVVSTEFVGVKKVKVRCMLEIKGYVIVPSGFEVMEAEEGLYTRLNTVDVQHVDPVTGGEILVEGVEMLPDTIDEVFSSESEICIDTVSTATDICEIKGICYTYLIYVSGGTLASKTLAAPFEAEILKEGVTPADKAYFAPTVISTGITLSVADGGTEVKSETVVYVKGYAVRSVPVEIVTDAYSKKKEIRPETERVAVEEEECTISAHEKFSGAVPIDAGEAGLKGICAIGAPWIAACNAVNADGLTVEGIVGAEIIYLDNAGEFRRALAEVPYRFLLGENFGCKGSLTASAAVTALNARVRPGDVVEVSGELCVEVHGSSDKEITYVRSYAEICDREIPDVAISLYLVKAGETLFDVAKELISDEAELMALNPDLELPLKEGERIVHYRI